MTDDAGSRLIVVRGIMQRSGTNFLHDLIRLHPDVGSHPGVHEDHLFGLADLLVRYADDTVASFRPEWPIDPDTEARSLLAALGTGLATYISAPVAEPRAATKMPNMDGLAIGMDLLPTSAHIAIVRDGRAVVESATKSFGEPFERSAWRWAEGARQVLDAQDRHGDRLLVVRYEDLVSDLDATLRGVLDHARLDADRYPFAEATALPVRGSSELVDRGGVHWKPVPKDSISPLDRASGWTAAERAVFDRVAGVELAALGYERDRVSGEGWQPPSLPVISWRLRKLGGRIRRRVRAKV